MLIINYSRMPNVVNYPSPFSQSLMKRNQAEVLWKRWRLLEDRELYNLATDPLQKKTVIGDHPEVLKKCGVTSTAGGRKLGQRQTNRSG